jgi:hypothetical protein
MPGRALGINAVIRGGFEAVYGTAPGAGVFNQLPFVSTTLGAEVPLIEDDQIGTGREPLDPTPDVTTNDGDVVVPVDTKGFGKWLKLLLGAPVTTGAGPYTHVFTSGAAALPSMTVEVGHPEIPAFFRNLGVAGNQLQIAMARRGLLNATISCIAQDETPHPGDAAVTVSIAAAAALLRGPRFAQATGEISKDAVHLGGVVSASFTFANGYEKVETIRPDGLIDGVDPLKVMMSGQIVIRFADMAMFNAANGASVALNFGWTNGAYSLLFHLARVFLPRVKRPIQGPNGIQATYNWQASGAGGNVLSATLVNDVASYAT